MCVTGREMAPGGARIARRPQELAHHDALADFHIRQLVEVLVFGIDPHRQPSVLGRMAEENLMTDQTPASEFVDDLAVGDGDQGRSDGR